MYVRLVFQSNDPGPDNYRECPGRAMQQRKLAAPKFTFIVGYTALMRTFVFALQSTLCVLFVMCGRVPEKFSFQPKYPVPGQKIDISYDPSGTILKDEDEINLIAYCFPKGIPEVKEIVMEKSNSVWHSSFTATDSTLAVYIVFKSEEQQDDNNKNAYLIPLFTADKNPVKGGMARQAEVAFYGGPYPCVRRDWEIAKEYLRKEFEFYPDQVQKMVNSYWYPLDNLHRDSATQFIRGHLEKLGIKKEKTLDELSLLINWHKEMNEKELAEKYENELFNITQNDYYGEIVRYVECASEISINRKRKLILNFIEDFPNSEYIDQLHDRMITVYLEKGLYKEAENYIGTYVNDSITRFLDTLSWAMIKGEIILERAVEFAEIAVVKARLELKTTEKPDRYTQKEWQGKNNQNLVDALDTYGFWLYTLGRIEESVPVFEEAVELNQRQNKVIRENYCRSLYETGQIEKAFTELESLVKENPWESELNTLFEEVYIKRKGSEAGLETFFVKANMAYRIKIKEVIQGQMIEKPAPLFTLNDLDGNIIRLADFKGNIVILDFWATWCGPCIAIFPEMQKLVDKYKDDDSVKFFFIDVLEKGDETVKKVRGLINNNNYTFHVLLDDDSCLVSSAYELSGIPSIFIIDPKGNIRFRPEHSGLNDKEFIEQFDIMIEILRGYVH